MKRYTQHKGINKLLDRMVRKGWEVRQQRRHVKLYTPTGRMAAVAAVTPSDPRAEMNFKANLRRVEREYDKHTNAGTHS